LQSSHLSHQTKFIIHKTLIRSVLFYGSETWMACEFHTQTFHFHTFA
jgi:hypothetical protein